MLLLSIFGKYGFPKTLQIWNLREEVEQILRPKHISNLSFPFLPFKLSRSVNLSILFTEFVQVISFTFSFGLEGSCRLELQSLMSISCRVGSHKYLTNQNQKQKNMEEEVIFAKYNFKYLTNTNSNI